MAAHRREREQSRQAIEPAQLREPRLARLLRLAEPGKVPALARRTQEDGQAERGRPERSGVQPVASSLQAREQRLTRPERRQENRDRRLEIGEERRDVGQRFDAQQPLRSDHAQQHDDPRRKQQAHQHEDVARTPGGKDVDEHERHGRPGGHGDDDEGHHASGWRSRRTAGPRSARARRRSAPARGTPPPSTTPDRSFAQSARGTAAATRSAWPSAASDRLRGRTSRAP